MKEVTLHPLPELAVDTLPELRLTEPEREWSLRVVHATVWNDKAAHRKAIALGKAITENTLSIEQARTLKDLLDANLETARINGMGGMVLLPLTDRLAIIEGE